jgi:integrase
MTKRIPPHQWPADWAERIFKAVDNLPGSYGFGQRSSSRPVVKKSVWWRALLLVARDIAMRTAKLKWVTFDQLTPDGTLIVRDEYDTLPTICKLAPDTLAALEPLRALKGTILPEPTETTPVGDKKSRREWFSYGAASFRQEWNYIVEAAGFNPLAEKLPGARSQKPYQEMPLASKAMSPNGKPRALRAFLDDVYAPIRLGGKSPRTLYLYRNSVRLFGNFLGRDVMLSDLTDDTFAAHLASLRERGAAAHTVVKEYCQICAMWRFAAQRHLVADCPTVAKPLMPRTDPKSWLLDDLRKIFNAIDQLKGEIGGVPEAAWWRALHYVIWNTGERISAVLDLRWTDFDLDGRWVTFRAESRKGKGEDLTHQIADYTAEALRAINRPKRDEVFPWPLQRNYLWSVYGRLLKRAGLPCGRGDKFHRLRRTVATQYQLLGGDASRMLGHQSPRVTERHYLDPRVIRRQQAVDLLMKPDAPKAG